ncbi:LytR/AlgR family response regulator transcription factor [Rivibacter subsaxonicus]|uniref:LytTR family two component transcriptional regulator n=1 Tax=Rivibacter subsaxonicus TaxID=457575 RepID=A0A4Q7W204_9BURK|nr:LytTR family DNA-binding domain-containing protein [Rivibacter subsaxonicus]RZU02998.1 LytTR family two component transcriptional regulator [Rivibacter subsaxonicus]
MPQTNTPTALIAEDEPLLAQALAAELRALWPELQLLATAPDGPQAVQQALERLPEVLFLDIRMPGIDGLEAAQQIVEDWPCERPLPLIVFVTAYDQHALAAFERAAVDYLLKPVQTQRLAQTCERLRGLLAARASSESTATIDPVLQQLQRLLAGGAAGANAAPRLRVIQAGVGNTLHMVPLDEVLVFEAADKYVRVLSAGREHLIRQSLRELLPQLDESEFWQVHRGTVVRATAIETAVRDPATGRVHVSLRGRPEKIVVSRLYAHRFKAM